MEGSIKLLDVIDIKFLQKLQDDFAAATGMAASSSDLEGAVTNPSNFTEFCMKLTRGTEEGLKRCLECGLKAGEESERTGMPVVYQCHAGLVDYGAPIIIDGVRLGTIRGGQVLAQPPDEEKFRRYALEIGVDPDRYADALRKIKIVPEQQIRAAANLLYQVMKEIGNSRTQYTKLQGITREAEAQTSEISRIIGELKSSLGDMGVKQKVLSERVESVLNILKNIDAISKTMSRIAEETQIISTNAYIEAARLSDKGKSFGVIAHEIRKLATNSKKNSMQVDDFSHEIKDNINEVIGLVKETTDLLAIQTQEVEEIHPLLEQILEEMRTLHG